MDASARELTRFNVISSRIRLARNVVGMPFPSARRREDPKVLAVRASAAADADFLFHGLYFFFTSLRMILIRWTVKIVPF